MEISVVWASDWDCDEPGPVAAFEFREDADQYIKLRQAGEIDAPIMLRALVKLSAGQAHPLGTVWRLTCVLKDAPESDRLRVFHIDSALPQSDVAAGFFTPAELATFSEIKVTAVPTCRTPEQVREWAATY